MDILKEIQNEEKELQTLLKDWGWQKVESFIKELIKKDRAEQLISAGVSQRLNKQCVLCESKTEHRIIHACLKCDGHL